MTLGELWKKDPQLREPVLDGLIRRGQVGNLISTSKSYKTYLILNLAVSMATRRPWLDRFPTVGGKVLVIDLELQGPDFGHRMRDIVAAMHVDPVDVAESVVILPLRGRSVTIDELEPMLLRIPPRKYAAVIIDPLYKTYPSHFDENSNPQMTNLYRRFERLAEHLDAAMLVVHHASKGSQADKSVIDVGAGAGAQARSPDAHMVIRPHEADEAVVFDARVRSFTPLEPLVLTWRYPLWERDYSLDPAALKSGKRGQREKAPPKEKAAKPVWTPERFAEEFITDEPQAKDVILSRAARADGLARVAAGGLLAEATAARLVFRHTFDGDNRAYFATHEQNLLSVAKPRPMTADELRRAAKKIGGMFPGQLTQELAVLLRKDMQTFDYSTVVNAAEEHRRNAPDGRLDYATLLADVRSAATSGGSVCVSSVPPTPPVCAGSTPGAAKFDTQRDRKGGKKK